MKKYFLNIIQKKFEWKIDIPKKMVIKELTSTFNPNTIRIQSETIYPIKIESDWTDSLNDFKETIVILSNGWIVIHDQNDSFTACYVKDKNGVILQRFNCSTNEDTGTLSENIYDVVDGAKDRMIDKINVMLEEFDIGI